MGWWSSFTDGISHAASWAVDHSGDIAKVVGTVAKVGGMLAAEAGDLKVEDDPSTLPTMAQHHQNFVKATDFLIQQAEGATKSLAALDSTTTTTKNTIAGLWQQPVSSDLSGAPTVGMYQDLSKILTISNCPPTYTLSDGTIRDTANDIGKAIFANAPGFAVNPGDPVPIEKPGFQFANGDNSLVIKGCHAYYAIPLGTRVTDAAWHGALHVETSMTEPFQDAYLKEAASVSFTVPDTATGSTTGDAGVDVWSVNLTISWTSAPYAQSLYASFTSIFTQTYPNFMLKSNTLTGTKQLLQVYAPPGVSPHDSRAAVTFAAGKAVQASLPSGGKPSGDAVGTALATGALTPDVEVTFSTIVAQPSTAKPASATVANGH